jgi:Zn-dependent peptidase ImmA (M78 family)
MEKKANFIKARNKASEILLLQDDSILFPIDVKTIKIPNNNIKFVSYKDYANSVNIDVNILTNNGEFKDAMIYRKDKNCLILYNNETSNKGRMLWTLAHEMGHLVLNHSDQNEISEIEANTFASQLLLPQCVLKALFLGGKKITIPYLQSRFGLSVSAAKSCLKLVGKKLENEYEAEYDDIILYKCDNFIKSELSDYFSYQNLENMDEERNKWLNDL